MKLAAMLVAWVGIAAAMHPLAAATFEFACDRPGGGEAIVVVPALSAWNCGWLAI